METDDPIDEFLTQPRHLSPPAQQPSLSPNASWGYTASLPNVLHPPPLSPPPSLPPSTSGEAPRQHPLGEKAGNHSREDARTGRRRSPSTPLTRRMRPRHASTSPYGRSAAAGGPAAAAGSSTAASAATGAGAEASASAQSAAGAEAAVGAEGTRTTRHRRGGGARSRKPRSRVVALLRQDETTPAFVLKKLELWELLPVTDRDRVLRDVDKDRRANRARDPDAT